MTYDATAGDSVTFYIKPREPRYLTDRIVLSQDGDLSEAELNALPNSGSAVPEPGAALALAGAGLLALRRRR